MPLVTMDQVALATNVQLENIQMPMDLTLVKIAQPAWQPQLLEPRHQHNAVSLHGNVFVHSSERSKKCIDLWFDWSLSVTLYDQWRNSLSVIQSSFSLTYNIGFRRISYMINKNFQQQNVFSSGLWIYNRWTVKPINRWTVNLLSYPGTVL